MKKIRRAPKSGLPQPIKERTPTKGGRRVLNMAPHNPDEEIVVGTEPAALPPLRPLKTKIKPRAPKRKRTVMPDVVVPRETQSERDPVDQDMMDMVESAAQVTEETRIGRPTLYMDSFPRIVRVMARGGATDREMADALGVTDRTFQRWKHVYPAFCQALVMGKGAPDDRVERSLFQRAVGYSFEKTEIGWYQGTPTPIQVVEHVPPDPKAAQYWLNNRRPKKWRNRQEITGADGKALVPKTRHTMTREELLAIAAAGQKGKA